VETIGFVGLGRIGLPICQHLLKRGRRVFGYQRSSLAEFVKMGGVATTSPADIARQSDIVFTCLPSDVALEEVVCGSSGLMQQARPGQIVVEFGSHRIPVKEKYRGIFAARGVIFLDGEVSGTPGMVAQRRAAIYLAGEPAAAKKLEPVVNDFADVCLYLGPFGSATKVKLINNLLVGLHIAGTAQAMAIALKAGIDPALIIKAVSNGSGASVEFDIRAPWMAERRFTPREGSGPGLARYLDAARELANEVGVATPLLDCVIEIYRKALPQIGERDVAAIIEHFESDGRQQPAEDARQQE
jgi:3-hydroxyisobutyrate dehydrogenase-like beta-hydroxyacid dehydrogenase